MYSSGFTVGVKPPPSMCDLSCACCFYQGRFNIKWDFPFSETGGANEFSNGRRRWRGGGSVMIPNVEE